MVTSNHKSMSMQKQPSYKKIMRPRIHKQLIMESNPQDMISKPDQESSFVSGTDTFVH